MTAAEINITEYIDEYEIESERPASGKRSGSISTACMTRRFGRKVSSFVKGLMKTFKREQRTGTHKTYGAAPLGFGFEYCGDSRMARWKRLAATEIATTWPKSMYAHAFFMPYRRPESLAKSCSDHRYDILSWKTKTVQNPAVNRHNCSLHHQFTGPKDTAAQACSKSLVSTSQDEIRSSKEFASVRRVVRSKSEKLHCSNDITSMIRAPMNVNEHLPT